MKRRTAIRWLSLIFGGAAVSYPGVKYYQLHQRPNFQMLDTHQALLDDLADTIIPATDSPGAREAGVGAFIIKMLHDCTGRQNQHNFIHGLQALMDRCEKDHARPFGSCSLPERSAILARFEQEAKPMPGILGKVQRMIAGDPFFTTLKNYTVLGYCTSQKGATMALRYDYIPGKYIGDIKLEPGQRAWATE